MTKPLPKTLQAWAAANPDKFEDGWAEQDGFNERNPETGWAYWIYFKPGWINEATETHLVHEGTVKEALEHLRHYVRPCRCENCLEEAARKGITLEPLPSEA